MNAWTKYTGKKLDNVMDFAEGYKQYLDNGKTEREFIKHTLELIRKAGFKDLETLKSVKPGDKIYFNNRNKSMVLFVVGKKKIAEGVNLLGAHIDSPRLDLKPNPIYESDDLVLFDTHYYGGIKKYQWVTHPLALHGVVCKKDGTTVDIKIGDGLGDPVFTVSDILIHLGHKQLEKPAATVVEGEQLNALIGSIPSTGKGKELVKKNILKLLKSKYHIDEEDFNSAELSLVPADVTRDLGLDRSMVYGYGQDDKVCAYPALKAIMDVENPTRTTGCILADKEEIGSQGNTGMNSNFYEYALKLLMEVAKENSGINYDKAIRNTYMLSNDVTAAYDPNYPEVFEKNNSSYLGRGIGICKYTGAGGKSGTNDANGEYVAKVRKVFDDAHVAWHICELGKVDAGGGGTIAKFMANRGMEVIDTGVPVQSMHSTGEITSKVDIYESYLGNVAFLKNMK